MADPAANDPRDSTQESPSRWKRLAVVVLIALAGEIAFFWALSKAFHR
jgi:hypothetical protein